MCASGAELMVGPSEPLMTAQPWRRDHRTEYFAPSGPNTASGDFSSDPWKDGVSRFVAVTQLSHGAQ